ncbi:MAG TPA: universal stress protein [Acidimicrobiia bacterium]|nr:universal stress protein [Acidimicrobiia bacterium]
MGYVSHKLKNSVEGALAGGGDPASSPLYVFGPFLKLVVAAGLLKVTFGASIWMVIFTITFVSLMYRSVMKWITDGSGGSGLSEEEFGSWAVKITAGITFVEYTLTFLVSMAALVTFASDRIPEFNDTTFLLQNRTYLAIVVSVFTAWLVNRGPKTAAKAFGPATASILILLWIMIVTVIVQRGFELPGFNLDAFNGNNIGTTFGGYARILAVMTGVEVFANLVAAYDGPAKARSNKAFESLMIIMVTTGMTMLIVGPAIRDLSDVRNEEVSVFTQTMDALLPSWLSAAGTLAGIAVLLSASASSALGLQNLFVGLKLRHYVPSFLGKINKFGVAGRPVWIEAGIASLAFIVFGTSEETYLALYAAGVFILLSMTGWAATKRLFRFQKKESSFHNIAVLIGTIIASILTTGATFIIFYERFTEGAWTYFLFIPMLFVMFSTFRHLLGAPTEAEAQSAKTLAANVITDADSMLWNQNSEYLINNIVAPIDATNNSIRSAAVAKEIAHKFNAKLHFVTTLSHDKPAFKELDLKDTTGKDYEIKILPPAGSVEAAVHKFADKNKADLIVIATRGKGKTANIVSRSVTSGIMEETDCPVLVIPPKFKNTEGMHAPKTLLVALDGSRPSERALSFAANAARTFEAKIVLLSVPTTHNEVQSFTDYLTTVKEFMEEQGLEVEIIVDGVEPIASIPILAKDCNADMIFMTTRGRSGFEKIIVGSITDQVVRSSEVPVFVVPMIED